jgi:hypothetical protein
MTPDESRCICDPDYRYGYDDRCPEHGYAAQKRRQRANESQERDQAHTEAQAP